MICIYSQNNTEYTKNGDAVLIPTSCLLAITINSSWQLSIEHPYDAEERYKYIQVGAVIRVDVTCVRELANSKQQRFRIYQVTKGQNSVSAIAFPMGMEASYEVPIDNKVLTEKTASQALAELQTYTNKYTLSTNVTGTASSSYSNTNLITALSGSDASSFLRTWGGELLYDNLNIKIRQRLGDNVAADHRIYYGRNLSSIQHELDDSGLITRIYPISQDGIRLNDSGYVDSSRQAQYPVPHAKHMQAPYNLIDTNAGSPSRTAVQTRTAIAAITSIANITSHSSYTTALNAGIQPEYVKTIRTNIVTAVQNMALSGIVSSSMLSAFASAIANAMAWMDDLEQPSWAWQGSDADGWRYGNQDGYAKNQYIRIGKTWTYFGDNGYWQEPKNDKSEWDWHETTDTPGKRYGNFNKYFAHNEYVYITMDGTLKEYWFNKEGWYEADESGDSDWSWHGSGTAEDPYWFGEDEAGDNAKKYAHDCWLFIDGVYYFFDSYGYYDGSTKFEDYRWDWVESDERFWFGNAEDKTYGATYLTSQWCKINGKWYYFDSNGYVESENDSIARTVAYFTTGMASLTSDVTTQKSALYALLYTLMTEYCNAQFAQGIDLPRLTISIDMADLSKTTEYEGYENLESIKLGDSVKCEDYYHNISTSDQRVIGLIYDCIRDYNSNIVLGSPSLAVSQMLGSGSNTNNAVSGGFDTSAIEQQLNAQTSAIGALQSGKQDKLVVGDNITIVGNRISATGGAGLQYWHETPTRFYREGTHEGVSGLANYLKPSNNEIGYWESGNGWTQAIVVRLTGNTRNVIMGYTTSAGNHHPHICFASQDELDYEWAWADGTLHPPYGITSWNNKATYPVTAGDYHYVYTTGTATYQGESWNVLLVDCVYWDGGDDIDSTEGITMFSQGAWGHKPSAGEVGLALLTTAQAKPYVDTVTEIGTENYTYKHSSSDKTYSSIDTDGNAVFKEVTTDKGSLTSQLNAKQNNLTAGANVSIVGDTISATDTTYNDFAGTAHGLVPANSDSEQKFLRNDGVWAMVSGGGKAWGGYNIPTSDIGSDGDYYYQFNQDGDVAITYVKINGLWYKIAGGDAGGAENCSIYGFYNIDGIGNNIGMEAYLS
jgi:phage minor structural protein